MTNVFLRHKSGPSEANGTEKGKKYIKYERTKDDITKIHVYFISWFYINSPCIARGLAEIG